MPQSRKIAFFAPIKPPDHPIPSGDRLIAQNLMKAMKQGGNDVSLASKYICYSKRPAEEYLHERKSGAVAEAERIIKTLENRPRIEMPDVWLTYHPYCKAPDWIGPIVTRHFGIPYLTAEAARTGQGDETDPWKPWREEAQAGIRAANMHFVLKPSDQTYLSDLLGQDLAARNLSPFVDLRSLAGDSRKELPQHWSTSTPVLITAGMMRKGKKDQNFYLLAETLAAMTDQKWNLVVVGGGPEEEEIRKAFSGIEGSRIHWTGQLDHSDVLSWMRSSDVFIWPGWREPIGMVYLEAQAQGLPVIAFDSLGVPLVVKHGQTGLLAPESDLEEMRNHIRSLLDNSKLRNQMSTEAARYVLENHSLEAAAKQLNEGFETFF